MEEPLVTAEPVDPSVKPEANPAIEPSPLAPLIELFCWGVIVALSVLIFVGHWSEQNSGEDPDSDRKAIEYRDVRAVASQTRLAIGARGLVGEGVAGATVVEPDELNTGSLFRRYAAAILVAEQESAERALSFLAAVDAKVDQIVAAQPVAEEATSRFVPDDRHVGVRSALGRVFEARAASEADPDQTLEIQPADSALLEDQFGWLGKVATTPRGSGVIDNRPEIAGPARRAMIWMLLVLAGGLLLLLGALVATVVAIVLFRRGWFRPRLPEQTFSSTVYLEAFVVGIVTMMLTGPLLVFGAGVPPMVAAPLSQLVALLASIGWPIARGVSFSRMADDAGLRLGRPLTEAGCGLFGYLCTVFALGCCLVLLAPVFVSQMQGSDDDLRSPPALHPVEDLLAGGDRQAYLMVFLLACILAPLVEEVLFRGLFFRYLRDRTAGLGRRRSVLASLVASGVVFAGIHPQNLVGLLPLFTLAAGMSLLREWRGSLVAPMTMHAVNNFLATTAMMLTQ
jgi:membrane protease YdiL (CAAX protease family)